jgi:hypothetical protein
LSSTSFLTALSSVLISSRMTLLSVLTSVRTFLMCFLSSYWPALMSFRSSLKCLIINSSFLPSWNPLLTPICNVLGALCMMDVYFHSKTQQTTVKYNQQLFQQSRTNPRQAIGPLAR